MYTSENVLQTMFSNNKELEDEIFSIYSVEKPKYTLLYNTILKKSSTPTAINSGFIVNQTDEGRKMSDKLKALFNPIQ